MQRETFEKLIAKGEAYMERVDTSDVEHFPLHAITDYAQGHEANDGSRLEGATALQVHAGSHAAEAWLDVPLYRWNQSTGEPVIIANHNPLVNTSECSPQTMLNLAGGIIEGMIPCDESIEERMLERIAATFLMEASPRALMAEFRGDVGFICKDDQYPSIYVSSGFLFFGAIATKKLLAFDVHDIAHHAVQIQQWTDFFTKLGALGREAFRERSRTPSREVLLARHLCGFVMDATLEESLLDRDGELHSFGCLNWLAPRDTPVAYMGGLQHIALEELRLVQRWHSLYAVKDLYRTQKRAEDDLGMKLDWVDRLGYDTDESFIRISEQSHPAPLESLPAEMAHAVEVKAPHTPAELLKNATLLLDHHGLNGGSLIPE